MTMTRETLETLVGAVVVLAAAAFIAMGAIGAGGGGAEGRRVIAEFGDIGALQTGADVRLGGVRVGSVSDLSLDPESYRAVATFELDPGVEVPNDSDVKILSDGLLGDSYVALGPGGSLDSLQEGDRIEFTQDAVNIIDLVSRLISSGVEYELEQQAQ
ncbi:MAG: outer membrane lipid asymmetry maintenance protein MlaD [Pseudomonadota bacterium]